MKPNDDNLRTKFPNSLDVQFHTKFVHSVTTVVPANWLTAYVTGETLGRNSDGPESILQIAPALSDTDAIVTWLPIQGPYSMLNLYVNLQCEPCCIQYDLKLHSPVRRP